MTAGPYPPLSATPTSPPQGGRFLAARSAVASSVYAISGCVPAAFGFLSWRDLATRQSPPLRGRCHAVTEGGSLPHSKVPPHLRLNARRMRHAMTEAELKLWNELRAHRLMGLGFRRQMPVGHYIADFACPEHKLIIEVDGSQHAEDVAGDLARTRYLEQQGWQVVRFWNDDVLHDIDNVCTHILRLIARPDDDH